jgi:hypothetical protein
VTSAHGKRMKMTANRYYCTVCDFENGYYTTMMKHVAEEHPGIVDSYIATFIGFVHGGDPHD